MAEAERDQRGKKLQALQKELADIKKHMGETQGSLEAEKATKQKLQKDLKAMHQRVKEKATMVGKLEKLRAQLKQEWD